MADPITLTPGEAVTISAPPGQTLSTLNSSGTSVTVKASNVVTPPPPDPTPVPPPIGSGILISPAEIAKLPTTGAAWTAMKTRAGSSAHWTLASQDSGGSATILAAALVAARTGDSAMKAKVQAELKYGMGTTPDRTLALGRELTAGILAADLAGVAPAGFDAWLKAIVNKTFDGKTLWSTAAGRPNNWGTHAFAALVAQTAYSKDTAGLDRVTKYVKGWLGDRNTYAGFSYGALDWQADPSKPVGINPKGALKQGHTIDGVLPDDQRRAGGFTWPPQKENYVWEALQGAFLAAILLERQGRSVWHASDDALLRAVNWLYNSCNFPATGDDNWLPWVINHFYGKSLSKTTPTTPGKAFGFTDWLYG